ncbi:MAG TPA: DNA polymerase Y family protein [Cyclobacteriaceae bacterium]|nr:DNA polymerase Y family protein [Cyclobacteriaceae bacterium]
MPKRFLSLCFHSLSTDWLVIKKPELKGKAFVLAIPERGRMLVHASSKEALDRGIFPGMVVADARALFPSLEVFDHDPQLEGRLLTALARWCIRYTPVSAVDFPDGIILDISGCAHLWGGETAYLEDICFTLRNKGYSLSAAIADTIGAAWAIARYGQGIRIAAPERQRECLLPLPPASLRLEPNLLQLMKKLGFKNIGQFIDLPPSTLRRRFGEGLLVRLGQALGTEYEFVEPVQPVKSYREELSCMEPIFTLTGIELALKRLLEVLCRRLVKEGKGLRTGVFSGLRVDGEIVHISIGTGSASQRPSHLFKLFELKLSTLAPGMGIELFTLEAPLVEDMEGVQESLWDAVNHDQQAIVELLDNIAGKVGMDAIHRYLPQEYHWPERSIKPVPFLQGQPDKPWPSGISRPLHLLPQPEPISVMVHLPDYPPRHFRYKGKIYKVVKADGPERIEQEWWLHNGPPRDYYRVEDEEGIRYWVFRLGLYGEGEPQWFLHGLFA